MIERKIIAREIAGYLKSLVGKFPAITITGPRQSGKTTLVRSLFKNMDYINLENPEEREFAADDPRGFLKRIPNGAILDEIQRAPHLLSYIQVIVDDRNWHGTFILTGSQQLEIMDSIDQSLAGRTALLNLLPLSLSELKGYHTYSSVNESIHKGFYPGIFDRELDPYQAYGDYYETYVAFLTVPFPPSLFDDGAKSFDVRAKSFDARAKSSDDGAKSFDARAKSSDDGAKSFDDGAKSFDVRAKSSDDGAKSFDARAKSFVVRAKSFNDGAKSFDVAAKSFDVRAKSSSW